MHPILQTARIPLPDFATDLSRVRGVRLSFNDTTTGAIYVANLRLSTLSGNPPAGPANRGSQTVLQASYNVEPIIPPITSPATLQSIRAVAASAALNGDPGFELEIGSTGLPFLAQNDLPRLRTGDRRIVAPSYYPTGDTRSMIFALTPEQYNQLPSGPASVEYSNRVWNFTIAKP